MQKRRFDVVFSNPPYGSKNSKFDINMIQELFSYAQNILFLHPSTFIFDKRFKWVPSNNIRNSNHLKQVIVFWGNKSFGIKLFCPLCISVWNINKKDDSVIIEDNAITNTIYKSKINDVFIHGNSPDILKLFNTVKDFISKYGSLASHTNINTRKIQNKYSIKFGTIRGNAVNFDCWNKDFFSVVCKEYQENCCDETFHKYDGWANPQKLIWSFNSEQERLNFYNYCKTKFVRFCLSFYKNTASLFNGQLEIIPWLDFSKVWNDKLLCQKFYINQELWNVIDKFIPDYYQDYYFTF